LASSIAWKADDWGFMEPIDGDDWGMVYSWFILTFTGWWLTYPSEKYESQLGLLFPIYGKIKNAPNHQPVYIHTYTWL
jgi:hypothetical protein